MAGIDRSTLLPLEILRACLQCLVVERPALPALPSIAGQTTAQDDVPLPWNDAAEWLNLGGAVALAFLGASEGVVAVVLVLLPL